VQPYADHLAVPARGASFHVLSAVPKRLEGLDYTLAILDEAGRIDRDVFEVVTLASGKQRASVVLAIGTPGRELAATVLGGLRTYAAEHPDDPLVAWREHSAAGFEHHPVDCQHCWRLANPALGDFLAVDGLAACLPPRMREASFRRARLCQHVDQLEDAWLPPGAWAACADPTSAIPDGADVVLGFDGSFSGDCTALVTVTVADRPHVELVELWEPVGGQVPIVDVEAAIRAACRRWRVLEVAADPFRWARSLQLLDGEGLPVGEYPQSPARMQPATARFYEGRLQRHADALGRQPARPPRWQRRLTRRCTRRPTGQGTARLAAPHRRRRGRRDCPRPGRRARGRTRVQHLHLRPGSLARRTGRTGSGTALAAVTATAQGCRAPANHNFGVAYQAWTSLMKSKWRPGEETMDSPGCGGRRHGHDPGWRRPRQHLHLSAIRPRGQGSPWAIGPDRAALRRSPIPPAGSSPAMRASGQAAATDRSKPATTPVLR
jgi:hypothetical protein